LRLSLVIPTFNERRNLADLVAQLTALLDPELGDDYELIVVDDDSPDRTWELASELTGKYSKLRVLRREDERGLSTAVIRGWQIARGDVLAVIDADLQHPPEVTVELWRAMTRGARTLAVGSRHIQERRRQRLEPVARLLSRGAQLLGLMLLPGVLRRVTDPMSGYFMIRRDAIAGVEMHPLGYKILVEVIGRGKVRWIAEVGYMFRDGWSARARSPGASTSTTCATSCGCASRRCRRPASSASRWWALRRAGRHGDAVPAQRSARARLRPDALEGGRRELAIINNFLWNDAWTFRDLIGDQRGLRHKLRRLLKFNLVCGIGLA
jgi:dolichol-phosphate mannosyltransferase